MAIAARYHTNLAIFHANVVGPVSEFAAAVRLSKHLGLDLKSVEVHDDDFIESIPEVTEHFGHPFYSCPHSVPYLAVCRLVRDHGVKAVLWAKPRTNISLVTDSARQICADTAVRPPCCARREPGYGRLRSVSPCSIEGPPM